MYNYAIILSMKKNFINFIFTLLLFVFVAPGVHAYQFDLLVLPTNLFDVCDNYFCFPEASNIIAQDSIKNFAKFKNINTQPLDIVREKMYKNEALKAKTEMVLAQFARSEKIDFPVLKEIADAFGAKSVLLITSYVTNDKVNSRRNIWSTLEITSAFKTAYPFEMKTSAVLTDSVNNIVMWSGKYSKTVSDSNDKFLANNQVQAMSQLEKIKQYSKDNLSQNISQNVFMRFFPKDVRTFSVAKTDSSKDEQKNFIPNALDKLSSPRVMKEYGDTDFKNYKYTVDDFSFEF